MDEAQRQLSDWLAKRHARCLWQSKVAGVGELDAWDINGHVVLSLAYKAGGFELFTTVREMNIERAFAEADERIGKKRTPSADTACRDCAHLHSKHDDIGKCMHLGCSCDGWQL